MGRPLRIDQPGTVHFLTNRGTAQTMLFRADSNRRMFLSLLGELEDRFAVEMHAYVLMGNHYHLIVRSIEGRLSEAMHYLDGGYARWFNAVHKRQGAFFQGRFDARHIEDPAGLERAGVYLHLNPLRAALVSQPGDHRWSSLGSYLRGRAPMPWLHLELLLAGRTGQAYAEAVAAPLEVVNGLELDDGDDGHAWWADIAEVNLSYQESDQAVARAFTVSIDELYIVVRGKSNPARMAGIVHAAQHTGQPVRAVAQRYGLRNAHGVHTARSRLRQLIARNPAAAAKVRSLDLDLTERS